MAFPSRDLVTWLVAIVLGAGATAIADASGARVGAGLTLGVIVTMVIVLGALAIERQHDTT
jgi:hypothetical protein